MRFLVACAAATLGGGLAQEPLDLSFHPARGSIVTKTFDVESSGWVDAITWEGRSITDLLALNGITVEATLQVRDEYVEVGNGRPLELLRDYDSLRTTWNWMDKTEVLHPLLYRTVRFTWDADDRAYDKGWDPQRGSTGPLEGVWEDLDFRSLLPEGEVRVGESWYVPLSSLAPVLLPGGAIHRDRTLWDAWKLFELEDALSTRSKHWFRNDDVACRLEEVWTEQGHRVARVRLAWRWWGLLDLLEDDDQGSWWSRYSTEEVVVELEMDAEGELLWDLDQGRFRSFLLEAECGAALDVRVLGGDLEVRARGWGRWMAEASSDQD